MCTAPANSGRGLCWGIPTQWELGGRLSSLPSTATNPASEHFTNLENLLGNLPRICLALSEK